MLEILKATVVAEVAIVVGVVQAALAAGEVQADGMMMTIIIVVEVVAMQAGENL